MIDDFIRSRLKSRKAVLRLQKLEKIAREAGQAEEADLSRDEDRAEPPRSKRKGRKNTCTS